MKLPTGVRRLLRLGEPERDVDDELRHHFEQSVAELEAEGLSPEEARSEAGRRFGSFMQYRRDLVRLDRSLERSRGRARRSAVARDVLVHALRSLVRAPALSLAVVVTYAIGLGANVTMFGIIDRLLLSPPPHVSDADELRRIVIDGASVPGGVLSYPDYRDISASAATGGVAVWHEQEVTLGHGLSARSLDALVVSGGYFTVLGAEPYRGRWIVPADTAGSAAPTVVISHALWQSEFGGQPDVLGRTLDFGSGAHVIIGIAPPAMTSLRLAKVDVWLPIRPEPGVAHDSRTYWRYAAVARLRDDVSERAVEERLSTLFRGARSDRIEAGTFDARTRVELAPLLEARGPLAAPEVKVARWVAGVSLILLLIACTNIANLFLARVVRQHRDIAVRMAIGITRRRLVSQILLEGVLLGAAGGAAALLLAHWIGSGMSTLLLPDVAWADLGWTSRVVPLTLAAAVMAGLLTSLLPALHASRPRPAQNLRAAGAGAIPPSTRRTRTALAFAQGMLSVLLLIGAGLFLRSLDAVSDIDLGYRLEGVHYIDPRFAPGTTTADERIRVRHALVERLRGHPAIELAAASSTAPFMWGVLSAPVSIRGRAPSAGEDAREHFYVVASEDYFRMLDIRLVRGRSFEARDGMNGGVALVNETMARELWSGGDALGECMQIGDDPACVTVVGVVRDTKDYGVVQPSTPQFYLPVTADAFPSLLLVRPHAGAGNLVATLRRAVVEADPRIRFVDVISATDMLQPQQRSWRLGATMFTAFGVLALLVAALGLYAVLAFDVSQRTREIGVRSALGADRVGITFMIVRQALVVTAAGVAAGLLIAYLAAPRLRDILFETSPHDTTTYAAVATTMLLTALLAAALPARRAASVDPNVALRSD